MPSLVGKTEDGKRGGIWEVKWTWMPAFLAMDKSLVKAVDERLNQLFSGGDPPMPGVLDKAVLDLICQRYPMAGLREALESIRAVDPAVKLHLVEEVKGTTHTASSVSGPPSSISKPSQQRGGSL